MQQFIENCNIHKSRVNRGKGPFLKKALLNATSISLS